MTQKIKIKESSYPVLFGYGAFRLMGRKWGCKGIQETIERLSVLDNMEDGLTFEQEDVIIDMILSGIECADADADLPTRNSVIESVILDPNMLLEMVNQLMSAFPKVDESKKKNPKTKTK